MTDHIETLREISERFRHHANLSRNGDETEQGEIVALQLERDATAVEWAIASVKSCKIALNAAEEIIHGECLQYELYPPLAEIDRMHHDACVEVRGLVQASIKELS